MAVIQHLQQRVEDIRMRLLDLVEQHHGERLAAHLLGELAALLITDVSRRRTKETRCRILLGELGHIDANQRILIVEQELGQRLGQLGLAHAGGAGKDERTGRALRVLQAHAGTADGAGQGGHRLILADNALVQLGFHVEQLLGLSLGQLEHRNTGGGADDLGDHVLIHDHLDVGLAFAPGIFLRLALGFQLLLVVAQFGGLLEVLALDGLVLLDVLAVLVGGGGADGLQLATGQHRLQHIGGTQCAVGRASPHDGVDLVDEQHDVAAGLDFLQDLLQTLLEITTVTGTGHHGTKIQRVDLLAFQGLRHIAGLNLLGQSFDHSGLAHTWLADQHRVVLGAAGEHDHNALDLISTADDRIQLAFGGFGGQVAAELVENGGTGLVLLVRHATGVGQIALAVSGGAGVAANHIDGCAAQLAQINVHLNEHLSAHAFALANQAEQNMLSADVAVAQLQSLTQRELQHLLGMRGKGDVPVRGRVALADHLFDLLAGGVQLHALRGECLGGHALTLSDQAEQQVFGADVVVLESPRLFLRQHDHAPCTVGKPFEHACPSSIDIPFYSTDSQ